MEQPVLQAKSLYFSYDGKGNALDGVSLNIYAGERIAVLGPNGAGKSTFFLCLNGVLTPERGEILLDGEPVGKKTRKRLCERAGIVFQNADDQIIASTVAAEVSFGPMNLRLPKDEVVRRVDHALDYMDLQAFRERPPHELSGGEKKRVTIADILAMESEIILFDEPAASLDPAGEDRLEAWRARKDGRMDYFLKGVDLFVQATGYPVTFHDVLLVAYLLDEQVVSLKQGRFTVELGGALTRGTMVDQTNYYEIDPKVEGSFRFADRVDLDRFFRILDERF